MLIKTFNRAGRQYRHVRTLAFDLFHALFRDKIIDLTGLPKDARVVKDGVDKGPSGRRRRSFRPRPHTSDNETHRTFMISTTNSSFAARRASPKIQDVDDYLPECRSEQWINGVVARPTVPEYVKGT